MKKQDIPSKSPEILKKYEELGKPQQEKEVAGSMEKPEETKVYVDLLAVEAAIKNSGIPFSIGNAKPSAWQSLVANIICYEQYHNYKNEKTFGKQYMEAALQYYDAVYAYYTFEQKESKSNSIEIKQCLETLLTSIPIAHEF